jgi:hypothetical protein
MFNPESIHDDGTRGGISKGNIVGDYQFDVTLEASKWADGVYEIPDARIKPHPQLILIVFKEGQSEDVEKAFRMARVACSQEDGMLRLSCRRFVPTVNINIAVYLEGFI